MVAVVYFLAIVSTSRAREGKLIVCDIILLFSIMENQWPIILSASLFIYSCVYRVMTNISYAAIAADD